jgi:hypothetical protein
MRTHSLASTRGFSPWAALAIGIAIVLTGCSGGNAEAEYLETELTDRLTRTDLRAAVYDQATARCVAEGIVDALGSGRIYDLADAQQADEVDTREFLAEKELEELRTEVFDCVDESELLVTEFVVVGFDEETAECLAANPTDDMRTAVAVKQLGFDPAAERDLVLVAVDHPDCGGESVVADYLG